MQGRCEPTFLSCVFHLRAPAPPRARSYGDTGALGIWGFSVLSRPVRRAGRRADGMDSASTRPTGVHAFTIREASPSGWRRLDSSRCAGPLSPRAHDAQCFWVGICAGFRVVLDPANLAWLLAAAALAGVIVLGSESWSPAPLGGNLRGRCSGRGGSSVYEIQSRGATFQFSWLGAESQAAAGTGPIRLKMLARPSSATTSIRPMWGGPHLPLWQIIFFLALVAFALYACFERKQGPPRRMLGLGFSVCPGLHVRFPLLYLRTPPHRPAPDRGGARGASRTRYLAMVRYGRYAVGFAAVTYLACALTGTLGSERIRSTGGVDDWSNAIVSLADFLGGTAPAGRSRSSIGVSEQPFS